MRITVCAFSNQPIWLVCFLIWHLCGFALVKLRQIKLHAAQMFGELKLWDEPQPFYYTLVSICPPSVSLLHLHCSFCCFSVMSVVAWRLLPASRFLQQSDWHLCANLTKERPATKGRPWGSISLALYSYRWLMEWQHFSFPLQLYLSCPPLLHIWALTEISRKAKWSAFFKKGTNHQKIKTLLLDSMSETVLTLCCLCEWALRRQKLALTFSPLSDENTSCVFSLKNEEWKGLRTSETLWITACNDNLL